jgi:hypothetical protein
MCPKVKNTRKYMAKIQTSTDSDGNLLYYPTTPFIIKT